MQSNTARAALAAVLTAAAVVLFVVLSDNGGSSSSDTTATFTQKNGKPVHPPTIVVSKAGQPVGGIQELDFNQGDQVRFRVHSAVADEVHVHGYDRHKEVKAGRTVSFSFPASLTGIFEAELEGRKQQIIELRVNP
ncbi:MAG TPA: hypothetical protein VF030_05410 [Solirubrobacterales bacterium]